MMHQRLREVVDYLKEEKLIRNQADFVERIGDNASTISGILSGRRVMTERLVKKVCDEFPNISPLWLTKGDGEKTIPLQDQIVNAPTFSKHEKVFLENEMLRKEIADYKREIREMSESIGALRFQLAINRDGSSPSE